MKDLEGIAALIHKHLQDVLSLDSRSLLAVALRETGEMIGEIMVMPQDAPSPWATPFPISITGRATPTKPSRP